MLKNVLWVSAGCGVLLGALALSNCMGQDEAREPAKAAPAAEEAAAPAAATASEPLPQAAPAPPTPDELQVQEDAAATGMTTVEPSGEQPPAEPPPASPPQ